MISSKQKFNIMGVLLILLFFLYAMLKGKSDNKELKNSYKIVHSKITGFKLARNNSFILFTFNYPIGAVNGMKSPKQIESGFVYKFLKGKYFPAIVSTKNPNNNELLILKEDFEAFNLTYPDSLKWVEDSIKTFKDPIKVRWNKIFE